MSQFNFNKDDIEVIKASIESYDYSVSGYIFCEECSGLGDDDQYTCHKCWRQGGNGRIDIEDVLYQLVGYIGYLELKRDV